jgi:hypothetical protein
MKTYKVSWWSCREKERPAPERGFSSVLVVAEEPGEAISHAILELGLELEQEADEIKIELADTEEVRVLVVPRGRTT